MADLAMAVGATTYLCGQGGARYLDLEQFFDLSVEYVLAPDEPEVIWAGANMISALRAVALAGAVEVAEGLEMARWA